MIARLLARMAASLDQLFDPHRDHSPALGALMREHEELLNGQRRAMGDPSYGVIGMSGGPFTDCFVHDGPAMAQRLTITLPLDLAAWIDAERGTATREEFALGRLYIAKIVGDLQHADIRSMQEAMRTHSVAAALRSGAP